MARTKTLLNGSMNEPFEPYNEQERSVTAVGWAPWWTSAKPEEPDWKNRQPVYGSLTLDGRPTQQLSTPFATHIAGLWQQAPTAAGNKYELTVEGQAWSSEDAAPASQLEASDVNLQLGVDPTGGLDPDSPLIVWSEKTQPLSQWQTLRLIFEAESSIMTIFLKSAPNRPKRQQSVFWRNARLMPIGRHKRSVNIIGAGDTHIMLEPEQPQPGENVTVTVSSNRQRVHVDLIIAHPQQQQVTVFPQGMVQDEDRFNWRYEFIPDANGLYDIRFVADQGARLLALRLLRVAREIQIVPSDSTRLDYERVYVLMPPTANSEWLEAAARGSFEGRFTIGFSADDAGIGGDLRNRHVLAVNPHHWPDVLTAAWFQQHYPGIAFTAVVANSPKDLESWLRNWTGET